MVSLSKPVVVLFDLDGTIVDSSHIVVDAYYNALVSNGFPTKDREFIATLAGRSTYDTARALGVPEGQLVKIDHYFWDYFGIYATELNQPPDLFPGTRKLIHKLVIAKIKIGICTSNKGKTAKVLLEKGNLLRHFTAIVGAEDLEKRKPSPEPIFHALEQMKIILNKKNKGKIWFVGDTRYDIEAAKAAGIVSIGIPQKYTKNDLVLAEPDLICNSMQDFMEFLEVNFSLV